MEATKFLALNIHIQGSFKKCLLLFGQAEVVVVVVWPLDHFMLKSTPLVNGVWIITFVSHLYIWVTKPKPSLMFFQLPLLTLNNVVWWTSRLFFLIKHNTLSKHPRLATCLFAMKSLISSLSLKIFCWWAWRSSSIDHHGGQVLHFFSFLMACWCSSCIFSIPFLVSHFTEATALDFLDRTTISMEASKLMKISWGFFALPRVLVWPIPSISD